MKKGLMTAIMAVAMAFSMSVCAFAGQWIGDASTGWIWMNDDGSFPMNQWAWIDDNDDGIAECYYFDENGSCILAATAPDGSEVNAEGAWIINGEVQHQSTSAFIENGVSSNITVLPVPDTIILTFTSGVRARWCDLLLSPDGSFTGAYEDAQSKQSLPFDGTFKNINKINEYSYSMTVGTLNNAGNAYGISEGDEFILYLPGTPINELPEDFQNTDYPNYLLYNINNGAEYSG